MLLIPDYINYLLTGMKLCEYTNAVLSRLMDTANKSWDEILIQKLGYPQRIYNRISYPGAVLGNLTRKVTEEVGYDCIIVQAASKAATATFFTLDTEKPEERIDAGPFWAAIGSILVLMISSHELKDVQEAKECVKKTFLR
jgi:rhamnulokinase